MLPIDINFKDGTSEEEEPGVNIINCRITGKPQPLCEQYSYAAG